MLVMFVEVVIVVVMMMMMMMMMSLVGIRSDKIGLQ